MDSKHTGSILEVQGLSFSYETSKVCALSEIDLTIRKGRKIALLGENGAGKSTLFLCLNGILKPQQGRLLLDGEPIAYTKRDLKRLRQRVGIVFQEPDQQIFLSDIRSEIAFGLLNLGYQKEDAARAADQTAEALGIHVFSDRMVQELSGGQKKLVTIADVLVMKPDIILLDEPYAGLDMRHRALVEKAVEKMHADGITLILSTHDIDEAYAWADEFILMEQGKILACGDPEKLCMDASLLSRIHQRQPMVLRLFHEMKQRGLVCGKAPRSVDALLEGSGAGL